MKKLYRSRKNRIIAGVCGGLGEYFKIDPVLLRIAFVLIALADGVGILIYIILIIIVPVESGKDVKKDFAKKAGDKAESIINEFGEKAKKNWLADKKNIAGLIIVIIGAIALFNQFFPIQWFGWKLIWSLCIIVLGLFIILRNLNKNKK